MRETLNRLLAYVTMREETPQDGAAARRRDRGKSKKRLQHESETDDVSYEKLFDED